MKVEIIEISVAGSTLIPFMNETIAAGFPSPALDHAEERIDLAKWIAPHPLSTFYVRATGDSLFDACIPPNSILVVDKSLEAKNGDVVVACINGEFTAKYFKKSRGICFLIPANKQKQYPVIRITEDMNLEIWGVVTRVVIDTKDIRECMPS